MSRFIEIRIIIENFRVGYVVFGVHLSLGVSVHRRFFNESRCRTEGGQAGQSNRVQTDWSNGGWESCLHGHDLRRSTFLQSRLLKNPPHHLLIRARLPGEANSNFCLKFVIRGLNGFSRL